MSDFEFLVEKYLSALRAGELVAYSWEKEEWWLVDASMGTRLNADTCDRLPSLLSQNEPILLVAEERQLLQLVSAYDLDLTDQLESGAQLLQEGVLGVNEEFLGPGLSIRVALTRERMLYSLIRRLQSPLVAIKQVVPPDL